MTAEQILDHIEQYRQKMMILASHSSMVDNEVVEVSSKLDILINQYLQLTKSRSLKDSRAL
ncbi:aspartyl-phosphate phosphatase Spo0E family protein [Peribacillus muralis]|uniref:aspartyl-phosphate phosphatase Spo0E family protein n=1 Tax=Peribacillus muralis TaxID=264697 RepID=UPI000709D249|nr:aspartyl-phosphate phosphatase Spo0E family protein [Peribacillus muralis]MCK1995064.1 aspartyl-phosphate phosphatase Spo0E family protein [Peribacillus muralis]MCK2015710.1 aspartyl-phosphate phosphatase Spo0E family protein [Peribacillus muralis]